MARHEISPIEWLIAAIGFVLVAGTLAFLLYTALSREASVPDVALSLVGVSRVSEGYVVEIRAFNRGTTTAASVKIEGELKRGAQVVERSETTFQYLPPGSGRKGGLFFALDPRSAELTLRPKGYEAP